MAETNAPPLDPTLDPTLHARSQKTAFEVLRRVTARKNGADNLEKLEKKESDRYGAMAHRLPILVRSAGLAQAMAFVNSRNKAKQGKDGLEALLEDLAAALETNKDQLLKRSHEAPLSEYMRLTRRTLAALDWFKRYAESVLNVKVTAQVDEGDEAA